MVAVYRADSDRGAAVKDSTRLEMCRASSARLEMCRVSSDRLEICRVSSDRGGTDRQDRNSVQAVRCLHRIRQEMHPHSVSKEQDPHSSVSKDTGPHSVHRDMDPHSSVSRDMDHNSVREEQPLHSVHRETDRQDRDNVQEGRILHPRAAKEHQGLLRTRDRAADVSRDKGIQMHRIRGLVKADKIQDLTITGDQDRLADRKEVLVEAKIGIRTEALADRAAEVQLITSAAAVGQCADKSAGMAEKKTEMQFQHHW